MAWKKATASSYSDLLLQTYNFCLKETDTTVPVANASNVGDGTMFGTSSTESSVAETWTVACTSGGTLVMTGNGSPDTTGTYTQTSQYGGMAYFESTSYAIWWDTSNLVWMCTLIADVGTTPASYFYIETESPIGTWAAGGTASGIPVTSGGAVPEFSVVGSVSGSSDTAYTSTPYSNGLVSFTLLSGDSVTFATGDSFTFDVEAADAVWEGDRYESGELIMHSVVDTTPTVYLGLSLVSDDSTYWNINIQGLTGYVDANDFEDQPGYSSDGVYSLCSDSSFEFWVFTSYRSVRVVFAVSSVVEHLYAGWIVPNSLPSQYNYPMFRGGTSGASTTLIDNTSTLHISWWAGTDSDNEGTFLEGAIWVTLDDDDKYPLSSLSFRNTAADSEGNYPVYPVTIGDFSEKKIYGDVEGMYYFPNYENTVKQGDFILTSSKAYAVFQDTFRSGSSDVVLYEVF